MNAIYRNFVFFLKDNIVKYIVQIEMHIAGMSNIPFVTHTITKGNVERIIDPVKLKISSNFSLNRKYIPSAAKM